MLAPSPTKSPFKFLDAYTAQDKDRFFGREPEQQRLIELLFRSRLMLVYGQSGTGKSSLVQCGLTKVMSPSDYFPVLIRRRANLLVSLQNAVGSLLERPDETDVLALVTQLSRYVMRPVYLIFDQFEEIFISGDLSEQTAFFDLLKALYESSASVKLLLVMREDYIAYLYPYEDSLPNLFDFRLRLEPMSEKNLQAVIVGTCRAADIHISDEEQTVQLIIDNNKSPKNPFQLPYLQVYLDRLWRTVQAGRATYETSPVIFDPALVLGVGKIDDVLTQFVDDQVQEISGQFSEDERPVVKGILEALVTYEGTRRECSVAMLATETGFNTALIRQAGTALEASRILQCEDWVYELAHDSLAKVIDKGRSTEQRQLNDILQRLNEAWREYVGNNKANDLLLPGRRLAEIQLYETALQTELDRSNADAAAIWQFVQDSGTFIEKERQAELYEQRKKNNRLRLTIAGISVLLVLAVIAMVYAFEQRKVAIQAERKAEESAYLSTLAAKRAQAALNLVTLQQAGVAQSTGLRYLDYQELELALASFLTADTLLRELTDKPDFPVNDRQSVAVFQRLKQELPRYIAQSRSMLPFPRK
ncbi:MAG: ATP-binding protein [Spirosoma sp.]|nr:ATP-binding protein [Spirosoma sp.]